MSTIETLFHTLGSYAPGQRRSASAALAATIGLYWEALRDGLAALRRYNELTARGVTHQAAVHEIFVEHFGTR